MKLEEEIIELFVNIIKIERDCEILKQYINDNSEFEPYAVFTRIDRFHRDNIDKNDLINFLKDSDYFLNKKDIKGLDLFIEYYDRDFDHELNFQEFLYFIVNKTNSILRALTTQKATFKVPHYEFLSKNLEDLISRLILNGTLLFEYADKKKLEIFSDKFNLLDLFILLDINKDGFIDTEDLDIFLRNRQVVLYKEEIKSLIALYDEDLDEKWNWNEYLFMILPSKRSYNYNYSELRKLENEYTDLYYESIIKERIIKDNNTQHILKDGTNIGNNTNEDIQSAFLNTIPITRRKSFENDSIIIDDTNYIKPKNYNDKILSSSHYTGFSETQTRDYTIEHSNNLELFLNELSNFLGINRDIENAKIELAYLDDFNLIKIFKFFDKYKMDYITLDTFINSLQFFDTIEFPNNIMEAELFFKRFDKSKNGKLK